MNDVSVTIWGLKSLPLHLKHFLRLYSNSACILTLLKHCIRALEQDARTNCWPLSRKRQTVCCNSVGKRDSMGVKKGGNSAPQPLHGLATPVDIAL